MTKTAQYALLLSLCAPVFALANTPWYQIEVIAFEYDGNYDNSEIMPTHTGEPNWFSAVFLMDKDTASAQQAQRAQQLAEAQAQAKAEAEAAEAERKKNLSPSVSSEFVTVGDVLLADSGAADEPEAEAEAPKANTKSKPITEIPYVALDYSQFDMKNIEQALSRSRDFDLYTHVAWRQPGLPANETETVRIYGGSRVASGDDLRPKPAALQGYDDTMWEFEALLKFSKSRFLHLDADMILRDSGSHSYRGSFLTPQELNLVSSSPREAYDPPRVTTLRLKKSQRVKTGTYYYYDHPKMGMIVKVTPYEPS